MANSLLITAIPISAVRTSRVTDVITQVAGRGHDIDQE
jgi:hypothetical protein